MNVAKVIGLLERHDIKINWQNRAVGNKTALHVAVEKENLTLVALLLGRGAEVHIRDETGQTALGLVVERQNDELLKLIAGKTISSLNETKLLIAANRAEPDESSPGDGSPDGRASLNSEASLRKRGHAAVPASSTRTSQSSGNQWDKSSSQHAGKLYVPKSAEDLNGVLQDIFTSPTPASKYQTHFPRHSAMTAMLRIVHFKTVKNIFVAILYVALINTLVCNFFEDDILLDVPLLVWCFGKFDHALLVWLVIFLFSFLAPLLQKAIIKGYLSSRIAYSFYVISCFFIVVAVPKYIRRQDFPPPTSGFVMCELVRLLMKMHSFLMVNRSLSAEKKAGSNDPNVLLYPQNVNFSNYFYFLWAPTLVYQISYPRTKKIRLGFVLKSFLEAFATVIYTYAIFVRSVLPHSREFMGDLKDLTFGVFTVMIPACCIGLMGFYGLLHSWLNAWAELTRFADRQFYKDWWNAYGWSQYHRKWNVVVHNFVRKHLFLELISTLRLTKPSATWVTLLISAMVYEYVISCSLGFYKPILLVFIVLPSLLLANITSFFRDWNGWNVFMWFILFSGHGLLCGLYARAWQFRDTPAEVPLMWWDSLYIDRTPSFLSLGRFL